jgi:hypothetical protein
MFLICTPWGSLIPSSLNSGAGQRRARHEARRYDDHNRPLIVFPEFFGPPLGYVSWHSRILENLFIFVLLVGTTPAALTVALDTGPRRTAAMPPHVAVRA